MYAKIKSHTSVGAALRRAPRAHGRASPARSSTRSGRRRRRRCSARATAARSPPSPARAPDAAGPGRRRRHVGTPARRRCTALGTVPEGFEIHPKLLPLLKKRAELLEGKGDVDWATARGAGLRHAAARRRPGAPVRPGLRAAAPSASATPSSTTCAPARSTCRSTPWRPPGARFEVYDSLLSEAAVMGFEFGYAVAEHRALVMWEAQFGDFVNGAQVIIDQFLAALRDRSGASRTGLVLLLPHGHEGQGPEHSQRAHRALPDPVRRGQHARLLSRRRPASYFHLLRRQGARRRREAADRDDAQEPAAPPALRLAAAGAGRGRASSEVLDDAGVDPARVRRVVLAAAASSTTTCSRRARSSAAADVALVRLEQLYPFPAAELVAALLARYAAARGAGLGAGGAAQHGRLALRARAVPGRRGPGQRRHAAALRRPRRPAPPAPGSLKVHLAEQEQIVAECLSQS